jgi:diaminohydroxyphosphoribosylaminopyrimidine deaminase / 5-amino-6-(5-phosphoribosylamino)uracil reductase
MTESENNYLLRCIELATKGGKAVKTNPLVGAVIVYNDRIIGEGFHEFYGGPHAEVNALNSIVEKDKYDLSLATLYVSLEPCCNYGKTPPCTQMIINSNIKKVVIGCLDPNPEMNGKSIEILQSHGIKVDLISNSKAAENLIRKFKANLQKRPYIILKWAQSFDGYLGHKSQQLWLSNQTSKTLTHKWRTEVDAILIGKNTALIDNPQLTARLYEGDNPVRVVIDRHLDLPAYLHLFSDGQATIVLNEVKEEKIGDIAYIKLDDSNPLSIVKKLFSLGLYSIIIEGGAKVLNSFIESGLWDEARVIKTGKKLSNDFHNDNLIAALNCFGIIHEERSLDDDKLTVIYNSLAYL